MENGTDAGLGGLWCTGVSSNGTTRCKKEVAMQKLKIGNLKKDDVPCDTVNLLLSYIRLRCLYTPHYDAACTLCRSGSSR